MRQMWTPVASSRSNTITPAAALALKECSVPEVSARGSPPAAADRPDLQDCWSRGAVKTTVSGPAAEKPMFESSGLVIDVIGRAGPPVASASQRLASRVRRTAAMASSPEDTETPV